MKNKKYLTPNLHLLVQERQADEPRRKRWQNPLDLGLGENVKEKKRGIYRIAKWRRFFFFFTKKWFTKWFKK